ncbi:hypothetical protein PIB30_019941 [Stylosanthes scabra]|uniref:Uncharacterized protein n=1 Tax=Stylosanthes scabra TaxID=79078 RepID=A0ABU6W842_9FABA|nr:hypothetical protein [Stylosanthes scabra]
MSRNRDANLQRLDELSLKRNKPPQDGGVNPFPQILGIHNYEDSNLTIDSSKPRVTGINSPAVHAWRESVNNTRVNPDVTRKNSPAVRTLVGRGVEEVVSDLTLFLPSITLKDRQLRNGKWALLKMVKTPLFIDAGMHWCICTEASGAYALVPKSPIGRAAQGCDAYALALWCVRIGSSNGTLGFVAIFSFLSHFSTC